MASTTRQADTLSKLTESVQLLLANQKTILDNQQHILARLFVLESRPTVAVAAPPSSSTLPSPSSTIDQSNLVYAAVVKATVDKPTIESKAKRLVVISLPEAESAEATAAADSTLVRELVEELKIDEFSAAYAASQVKFHRHPVMLPGPSSSSSVASVAKKSRRPLKIEVPSADLRSLILSAVRRRRPACLKPYDGAYIRRDLTAPELVLERQAKETVRMLNREAGEVAYGVRDTEVYKYPKPRPFSERKA